MSYTLFVDESGHAGMNYLDQNQPFQVVAGVLVKDEDREALREVVLKYQDQAPELKAKNLLKTPTQRAKLAAILRSIRPYCVPFWCAMERRFALTLKIVDVFCDPTTNPAAAWLDIEAKTIRDGIADELLEQLPIAVVEQFARAYKEPTAEGFSSVLEAIQASTRGALGPRTMRTFEGALRNVATIARFDNYDGFDDGESRHFEYASLNVPTAMHAIRLADRFVGETSAGGYKIVHDEISTYERVLELNVRRFTERDAPASETPLDDGTLFHEKLRYNDGFEVAKSDAEPCIQVADLLAGVVARGFKAATRGDWLPELTPVCFPALYLVNEKYKDGNQMFASVVMSGRSKGKGLQKFAEILALGEQPWPTARLRPA